MERGEGEARRKKIRAWERQKKEREKGKRAQNDLLKVLNSDRRLAICQPGKSKKRRRAKRSERKTKKTPGVGGEEKRKRFPDGL